MHPGDTSKVDSYNSSQLEERYQIIQDVISNQLGLRGSITVTYLNNYRIISLKEDIGGKEIMATDLRLLV